MPSPAPSRFIGTPPARSVHWVVKFDNNRPAIPFLGFDSAYSLAKRATRDNHPAQAVEVYEHAGKFYDCKGSTVTVRGVA